MSVLVAEDIRELLIDSLGDEIGLYNTPQGKIPAIRVYSERLSPEWTIDPASTGIEVIIPVNPSRETRAKNVRCTIFANIWECRLVLHRPGYIAANALDAINCKCRSRRLILNYRQMAPSDMSSEQWLVRIEQMCQD